MTVVGLVEGAVAILLAFAVAMVAFSPMLSLTDAYALTGLGARGRAYGPVRLWGSVAFIAGNVGAGFILEVIAPGHLIWLIVVRADASSSLAAIALDAGRGRRGRPRRSRAPVAEDAAAQSGVHRGRAGVEHDPEQPRALLRLLDPGMARRRPRRHRDRRAVGRSASRPRSCCLRCLGAAAEGAPPDHAAGDRRRWARSSAGPRWRSIRRSAMLPAAAAPARRPRSARRISA